LIDEEEIIGIRNKFIHRIKDFVAQNKSGVLAAIQEIKSLLTASGLPESILGPN